MGYRHSQVFKDEAWHALPKSEEKEMNDHRTIIADHRLTE